MRSKYSDIIKNKKRIVIKIGSSSLQHKETGDLDYTKMDILVREICDLRNKGKDVVLVTSGAISCGRKTMNLGNDNQTTAVKQACSAIGQAKLIMTYEKIFSEYNQIPAQILMNKNTITNDLNRFNAHNTFSELLKMGVVPIVNENDTVATYEIKFGDNDTLSAIVTSLIDADLLILLSDIDGLYTDNPRINKESKFINLVEHIDDNICDMAKPETGSSVGTGGMYTKITAAKIATKSGADMIICNSEDIHVIHRIMDGRDIGTLFVAEKDDNFYLSEYVEKIYAEDHYK